jgi:hypothetical protein
LAHWINTGHLLKSLSDLTWSSRKQVCHDLFHLLEGSFPSAVEVVSPEWAGRIQIAAMLEAVALPCHQHRLEALASNPKERREVRIAAMRALDRIGLLENLLPTLLETFVSCEPTGDVSSRWASHAAAVLGLLKSAASKQRALRYLDQLTPFHRAHLLTAWISFARPGQNDLFDALSNQWAATDHLAPENQILKRTLDARLLPRPSQSAISGNEERYQQLERALGPRRNSISAESSPTGSMAFDKACELAATWAPALPLFSALLEVDLLTMERASWLRTALQHQRELARAWAFRLLREEALSHRPHDLCLVAAQLTRDPQPSDRGLMERLQAQAFCWWARYHAIDALERLGTHDATWPARLLELTTDPSPRVAHRANAALAKRGSQEHLARLRWEAENSECILIRAEALWRLAEIDVQSHLDLFVSALLNDQGTEPYAKQFEPVADEASYALSSSSDPRALSALLRTGRSLELAVALGTRAEPTYKPVWRHASGLWERAFPEPPIGS